MPKKLWQSKTLWTNALALLGGLGAYATTDETSTLAIAVLGLVNMGLRLITQQPLGF